MNAPVPKTALLLDEHPLWLDALEGVIRRLGLDLVGKVTEPAEAVRLVELRQPALLVLDPQARDAELDGLECLRLARELVPTLKAVAIAASDEPRHIESAFAAGASAYLVKRARSDDLAVAIRQAFEHSLFLADAYAARGALGPADAAASVGLTRRECDILRLVAEGKSNKEVASALWVAEQTVKFHLGNVFRKLKVENRTQAGNWAHAHGLLGVAPRREPSPRLATALEPTFE
jgi:NarL family two-component system response regulator LiaR